MWYRDEFHGRGKIFNDEPQELDSSFNYQTFEDDDKYWVSYEGNYMIIKVILCMMRRRDMVS